MGPVGGAGEVGAAGAGSSSGCSVEMIMAPGDRVGSATEVGSSEVIAIVGDGVGSAIEMGCCGKTVFGGIPASVEMITTTIGAGVGSGGFNWNTYSGKLSRAHNSWGGGRGVCVDIGMSPISIFSSKNHFSVG